MGTTGESGPPAIGSAAAPSRWHSSRVPILIGSARPCGGGCWQGLLWYLVGAWGSFLVGCWRGK